MKGKNIESENKIESVRNKKKKRKKAKVGGGMEYIGKKIQKENIENGKKINIFILYQWSTMPRRWRKQSYYEKEKPEDKRRNKGRTVE